MVTLLKKCDDHTDTSHWHKQHWNSILWLENLMIWVDRDENVAMDVWYISDGWSTKFLAQGENGDWTGDWSC